MTLQQLWQHLSARTDEPAPDFDRYLAELNQMNAALAYAGHAGYLIDYVRRQHVFVSANSRQVIGASPEAYYEAGPALTASTMHPHDFTVLNEDIFRENAQFLQAIDAADTTQYRFVCTYRVNSLDGNPINVLQQHTVIRTVESNLPVAVLGSATNVTAIALPGKMIHRIERLLPGGGWEVVLAREYYPDTDGQKLLSDREKEILKWVLDGYSSEQIAARLHISYHTVRTHRKNIAAKTNARNTADLFHFALKHHIV